MRILEKQFRKVLSILPNEIQTISKSLLSYIPGLMRFSDVTHSSEALYCYSRYLVHISLAQKIGLNPFPKVVLELGPGTSFGIGLAALLCGSESYYAIDEIAHARIESNIQVLNELVELFKSKKDPGEESKSKELVKDFPEHFLKDAYLNDFLEASRVERIRTAMIRSIRNKGYATEGEITIGYFCPFRGCKMLPKNSVDMAMSTVVLQAVQDLPTIYSCLACWLKPGSWMSHFIDFGNYGMTTRWNGHWAYPRWLWRFMQGNRPYLHNRAPHSRHIQLIKDHDFEIVTDLRTFDDSGIARKNLAKEFRSLSNDDLRTSGALIQAVKGHVC